MHTTDPAATDRAALLESLDLDVEKVLPLDAGARSRLEAALAADPSLAAERRRLAALHGLLAADRALVHPGFRAAVMAGLPVARWEERTARRAAWALPVALVALFALAAAAVLGAAGGLAAAGPLAGTGIAVVDFLGTTLLAGAGLLGATWTGVGLGLEELFARSQTTLVGFGILVLMIDLLLFSLLRRRPARQGAAARSAGQDAADPHGDDGR